MQLSHDPSQLGILDDRFFSLRTIFEKSVSDNGPRYAIPHEADSRHGVISSRGSEHVDKAKHHKADDIKKGFRSNMTVLVQAR